MCVANNNSGDPVTFFVEYSIDNKNFREATVRVILEQAELSGIAIKAYDEKNSEIHDDGQDIVFTTKIKPLTQTKVCYFYPDKVDTEGKPMSIEKLLDVHSDTYLKANIDLVESMEFAPAMESEWIEPQEQTIKNILNSQY